MPDTAAAPVLMVRVARSRSVTECDLVREYCRRFEGDSAPPHRQTLHPLPIASMRAAELVTGAWLFTATVYPP